ncbi:MAG: NusG-like protein [Acidobacteria bacterium]|nr:NusG-like protein [Acidobacteriota bacterium]
MVSQTLQSKGYMVCDAITRCRRAWSDRVKEVDLPLFPGYVFCRFDPLYRLPIVTTPNVVSVVGFGGVPEPVKESEMEAVQALLRSGLPVQAWPFLRVGDTVTLTHGAFKGVEGILTQTKSRHRLVVSVTLLRRSVAVEIEDAFVRPASTRRPQG